MNKKIHIDICNPASVRAGVTQLRQYAEWINTKAQELAERLARYGLQRVQAGYAAVPYDGVKDYHVEVEQRGKNAYAIVASGQTVLFLEFGSGISYGAGHPLNAEYGMGPGTYPGQTHVPDPGYWWYTGTDGESHYSAGNAPSMAMYIAGMDMRMEIERIAREVFSE